MKVSIYKIYMIKHKDYIPRNDGEFYLGLTASKLKTILVKHRYRAKDQPNKLHHYINSIGWGNIQIYYVEILKDYTLREAQQRLKLYIDKFNPNLIERHILGNRRFPHEVKTLEREA